MKETLNLLPIEGKPALVTRRSKTYYLFFGLTVYIVIILSLWFFNIIETKRLDSEIKKLNSQKAELQQKILPTAPPTPTAVPAEKEILNAIKRVPPWSSILSEISLIVPGEVWLSSIESKEDKGIRRMNIKGFSTTQLGVANLISALEASHYFYAVEIVFSQKGEKHISFELRAKLRWT